MREAIEAVLVVIVGSLGLAFLCGVVVGMVFAGAKPSYPGGRRGVAIPVKDDFNSRADRIDRKTDRIRMCMGGKEIRSYIEKAKAN